MRRIALQGIALHCIVLSCFTAEKLKHHRPHKSEGAVDAKSAMTSSLSLSIDEVHTARTAVLSTPTAERMKQDDDDGNVQTDEKVDESNKSGEARISAEFIEENEDFAAKTRSKGVSSQNQVKQSQDGSDTEDSSVTFLYSPTSEESTSGSVSMEITISLSDPDTADETLLPPDDFTDPKVIDILGKTDSDVHYKLTTLNSNANDVERESEWDDGQPHPIVSTRWQHSDTCDSSGGSFRKPGSDVILHVPSDAVCQDSPVVIHTAVCSDVDRVRRVLQLRDEDQVVSPLAEYWAGPQFRFQRPVCITLPHCLPKDPDLNLVRVYRVSRGPNGHVIVTRVRRQADCGVDGADTEQGGDHRSYETGDVTVTGEERAGHPVAHDDEFHHGEETSTSLLSGESRTHFSDDLANGDDCSWEESGYFQVSPEGQVHVTTDHFCGYVCAYCGRSQGPPELVVIAYGSYRKLPNGQRLGDVDLYVWDGRMDIADFRAVTFLL